jgi:hypothetical protein
VEAPEKREMGGERTGRRKGGASVEEWRRGEGVAGKGGERAREFEWLREKRGMRGVLKDRSR